MIGNKKYLKFVTVFTLLIVLAFLGIEINGKPVTDNSKENLVLMPCGTSSTEKRSDLGERFEKIFKALEDNQPLPKLCVELHKQSIPENNVSYMVKKVPLGDTVFMRYYGIFSGILSEKLARTFTAITISNDIDFKLKKLTQLTHHDENLVRYRAWLELARLHLRNKNWKKAESSLSKALNETLDNEDWKVDAHFLQAYIHLTNKKINSALSQLETALAGDPNFVDAYVLYIRALLEASLQKETFFSKNSCTTKLTKLMDSIDMIACVTNDRHTFIHLAKSIEQLSAEQKIKSFMIGYSNLLAGNYSTVEQHLKSLLNSKTQWKDSPCTNLLVKQIPQILEKVSTLKQ
ncbi:hypothetical protein [Candidatus Parabeggiatoa sp. HSG14]|uniref:tetratricopeptide repeat protein n=1 Tax=Candidatus Parabeggiatoa sp. HSG14 TaxID=3055593 RepID=UPI0025A7BA00|nr:hypothetical protein [Thiotrichales bacterium HSG14]